MLCIQMFLYMWQKMDIFAEYTANNNRILNEITDFEIENIEVSIDKLAKWYMNNKEKIDREKLLYQ